MGAHSRCEMNKKVLRPWALAVEVPATIYYRIVRIEKKIPEMLQGIHGKGSELEPLSLTDRVTAVLWIKALPTIWEHNIRARSENAGVPVSWIDRLTDKYVCMCLCLGLVLTSHADSSREFYSGRHGIWIMLEVPIRMWQTWYYWCHHVRMPWTCWQTLQECCKEGGSHGETGGAVPGTPA